ncbi:hypothetical protein SESBI_46435 [Sesbania bispinosa]|nr:hypothetical protein SESBI_46435 [Sesbania bispinosa]
MTESYIFLGFTLASPSLVVPPNDCLSPLVPPPQAPNDFNAIELLIDKLLTSTWLAPSVTIVVGTVAVAYGSSSRLGRSSNAVLGGATALGAIGGASPYTLNVSSSQYAAASLHNYDVGFNVHSKMKMEDIEAIANQIIVFIA